MWILIKIEGGKILIRTSSFISLLNLWANTYYILTMYQTNPSKTQVLDGIYKIVKIK